MSLPESVYLMTDKYLSQLIEVAVNKEKDIRLSQALHCLENEKIRNLVRTGSLNVWQNTGLHRQMLLLQKQEKRLKKNLKSKSIAGEE